MATFIVQDDNGNTEGANAYIPVEFLKEYASSKGFDHSAYSDEMIEQAIVRATLYVDARFEYIGTRRNKDQTTLWPRSDAYDIDNWQVTDIPLALKKAVAEYTLRALTSIELMPDPETDAGRMVASKTETLGPITESVSYFAGGQSLPPRYPLADSFLRRAGLVRGGGSFARA